MKQFKRTAGTGSHHQEDPATGATTGKCYHCQLVRLPGMGGEDWVGGGEVDPGGRWRQQQTLPLNPGLLPEPQKPTLAYSVLDK